MIPKGDVPKSDLLIKLYSQLPLNDRLRKVVIDSAEIIRQGLNVTKGKYKFQRICYENDSGIEPEEINNWNELVFCDYKISNVTATFSTFPLQRLLLERFLFNPQPLKLLHLSLDQYPNGNAEDLLKKNVENLQWRGRLGIEINDRTQSIKSAEEARKLTRFFPMDRIESCYYWNNKLDSWGGWGMCLMKPNDVPETYG